MTSDGMRLYSCVVLERSSNNDMASIYHVVIRLLVPPSSVYSVSLSMQFKLQNTCTVAMFQK